MITGIENVLDFRHKFGDDIYKLNIAPHRSLRHVIYYLLGTM